MRRFGVRTSDGIVQNANAYANGEEPKSALQSDTDLVNAAGWNPDRWSLAGRQSGYMTMPDGHRQRVALVAEVGQKLVFDERSRLFPPQLLSRGAGKLGKGFRQSQGRRPLSARDRPQW